MASQLSYKDVQTAIDNDPALLQAIKEDPKKGLAQAATVAEEYRKETDPVIYRTVVYVLSAVLIITVLTIAVTLFKATVTNAPVELIVGLGSTALGALAGLLAPSPVRGEG